MHVGSTFEMGTPTGVHTYTVSAVLIDYTSDQGSVFLDRRIFIRDFKDNRVDSFELYFDDPSQVEAVRKLITERYGKKLDLYVLTNQELRKEAKDLVDGAFAVTYAMEGVAVLLALLGVINTLLAAVLDRTREIGLLRAIGDAKSHIVRLFVGEALLVGLTGGLLGATAGALMGYITTKVIGDQGTGWSFPFRFPTQLCLQMVSASIVCACLAGLYPARRAAQLEVVDALSYE
jgi:putative ABC transport system permease protein